MRVHIHPTRRIGRTPRDRGAKTAGLGVIGRFRCGYAPAYNPGYSEPRRSSGETNNEAANNIGAALRRNRSRRVIVATAVVWRDGPARTLVIWFVKDCSVRRKPIFAPRNQRNRATSPRCPVQRRRWSFRLRKGAYHQPHSHCHHNHGVSAQPIVFSFQGYSQWCQFFTTFTYNSAIFTYNSAIPRHCQVPSVHDL